MESCPLTKLADGILQLHSADDYAVSWQQKHSQKNQVIRPIDSKTYQLIYNFTLLGSIIKYINDSP